jgi:hypothetical protein
MCKIFDMGTIVMSKNDRLKSLNEIYVSVRMMRAGAGSPAISKIVLGVIIGVSLGYLTSYNMPTVIGGLLGGFIGFRLSKYKNWESKIYDQLAQYQPVNKQAYKHIQSLASAQELTSLDVLNWVSKELEEIQPKNPNDAELARQRFVNTRSD